MVNHESFGRPTVFPIAAYGNDLTGEECTDEDHALVSKVVGTFGLDSFGEYRDVYLYTGVLALAD